MQGDEQVGGWLLAQALEARTLFEGAAEVGLDVRSSDVAYGFGRLLGRELGSLPQNEKVNERWHCNAWKPRVEDGAKLDR